MMLIEVGKVYLREHEYISLVAAIRASFVA